MAASAAFIFEVENLRPFVSSHVSGERLWFQSNMEGSKICRQSGERRRDDKVIMAASRLQTKLASCSLAIEAQVPAGKIVHVILDNYAAHKQPKVLAWLARHPRFTFHFTPTSCSWLNAVETFFATLAKRRLKRGVFRSVVDLQAAINRYLDEANHDPKPFIWTADPDKIIAAVSRGRQALKSIQLVVVRVLARGKLLEPFGRHRFLRRLPRQAREPKKGRQAAFDAVLVDGIDATRLV